MVSVDVKHHVYLLTLSLSPHLHTPYPFSRSLISLMVSVDAKHQVYLLTYVLLIASVSVKVFLLVVL